MEKEQNHPVQFGKYQILEELGRGGFGIVYHAFDTVLEVERAIKELYPNLVNDPSFVSRFRQEARVAAKLDHPNLVSVHDFGQIGGKYYLAMGYMPGGSLKDLIKREGKLVPKRALEILEQVGAGLSYAHSQGVIHRDLKPGNILFDGKGQARVSDLGFARVMNVGSSQSLSVSGGLVGTPAYMAPETWRNKPATPQTDIYSLGCILYEMLTGEVLFEGESPADVMTRHVLDEVPALLSGAASDISDPLLAILEKTLSKHPQDRYGSVTDFTRELSTTLAQPAVSAAVEPLVVPEIEPAWENPVLPVAQPQVTTTDEKTPATPASKPPSQNPEPLPAAPRKGMARPVLLGIGVLIFLSAIIAIWWGNRAGPTPPATQPIPTATALRVSAPTDAPTLRPTDLPTETATLAPTLPPTSTPTNPPTSAPTSEPGYGETRVRDKDGMVQVYVPAGTFSMGSEDGVSDEKPVHEVYLDGYWIDQFEVTNAQYQSCENAGACAAPSSAGLYIRTNYYRGPSYADYPVMYVSWAQAKTYCEWAGGRLPTEAEWEKAARGDRDQRTYPWGEGIDSQRANYGSNLGDTAPVGSYPNGASPYGVMDLAGNVWEWVADWYASGYYANSPTSNPSGPATGANRVLRGGSWNYNSGSLRVSFRNYLNPGGASYLIGFRCVGSP